MHYLCKDSKILVLTYTISFPLIEPCRFFILCNPSSDYNTSCTRTTGQVHAAFIVASPSHVAASAKSVRREARSRSPVLQGGTSGCSPGTAQAIASPLQSPSACGRPKGGPPSCSRSSLLCSGTRRAFSSHGAPPPECASSLGTA
jgi:hypothetical protein